MKIKFLMCFSFLMANFAISQCYGPEFYVDADDNGFWTANEWDTNGDGIFNELDDAPHDCNGNSTWDAAGCLVTCDTEFKINSITANGQGSYNLDIHYKSSALIGGYQFKLRSDLDNTPGVNGSDGLVVTGNVGGDLTNSGFTVSGTTTLLAFSFSGATIPVSTEWSPLVTLVCGETGAIESGTTVIIDAVNNSDSGLVVSGTGGVALVAEFHDTVWSLGDDWDGTLGNDMINPYSYSLKNNYPNPFNPSTTIEYSVAEISDVNISIYDASGRLVKNLVSSQHVPGDSYQVNWNGVNEAGTSVSAGMYFYKINAGSFVETKKMLLIK